MTATFHALSNYCSSTKILHFFSSTSMRNKANYLYATFDQNRNNSIRLTGTNCANRNFEFDAHASAFFYQITFHDQIDSKWFVGKRTGNFYLFFHPLCIMQRRSNNTQTARITYCSSKFSISNVSHCALNNGVFNTQHFTKFCLHVRSLHPCVKTTV